MLVRRPSRFGREVNPCAGTAAASAAGEPVTRTEAAVVVVRLSLILFLIAGTAPGLGAQAPAAGRFAACRCEPGAKPKKPRFLLPVAGGVGFLPIAMAARDSQLPAVGLSALVDIRDNPAPRTALDGERALEVGALAPDTATVLPTLMLVAAIILSGGVYLLAPRRRVLARFWRSRNARPRGGWRLRTVHRRRLGGILAASGGLLLVLGSREYAEGAQAQRRARAEWLQVGNTIVRINDPEVNGATRLAAAKTRSDSTAPVRMALPNAAVRSAVPLPLLAMSGREIRRGAPVARLLIPTIDLDEIVMEGVGPVELNGGPGHFPGSVLPGESGNSILSAHRDRHFRRVGELEVGDHIRTDTRTGSTEWVITERRIVSRDTPSLFQESEATLTLTTCWPLRYFGPAPDRLLIVAKPLAPSS